MIVRTRLGALDLLQREADRGSPQIGVFIRRPVAPQGRPIQGVALAFNVDQPPRRRWAAWLSEGHLAAAAGPDADKPAPVVDAATGLQAARLLSPGYQFGDGTAQFLITGLDGATPVLRAYRFAPGRVELLWQAQVQRGALAASRARRWATGAVDLVWAESAGHGAAFHLQHIAPEPGGAVRTDPPRLIGGTSRPVLAWEVSVAAAGADGALIALSGPDDSRELESVTLPLTPQGGPPTSVSFPAPPIDVASWAILPSRTGAPAVAAWSGREIVFRPGGEGGGWARQVTDDVISHADLLSPDHRSIWLEWIGERSGAQRRVVSTG
jgi:hypothetical protein